MMRAHFTLFLALLPLCAGTALAKTPDGQPPSQETVCDGETGAAYGLCNAYCEAMDCDSGNPHASANACSKKRSKFQNITGRDVPCEAPCPCIGIAAFDSILANANSCQDDGDRIFASINDNQAAFANAENFTCGYGTFDPPSATIIPIRPAQALACLGLMRDALAGRGLNCQPPE